KCRRRAHRGWSVRPPSARACSCRFRRGHAWLNPSCSAGREGGKPPCCSTTATHVLMHSSQIYTDGPATSRPTSSAVRPQNEQRSLDRLRSHRAMAVSVRPMFLYKTRGARSSPCRVVSSFRAQGGRSQVSRPAIGGPDGGSRLPGGALFVLLVLEE